MSDRANFTVRLIDKLSGPGHAAEKAMGKLRAESRSFGRTGVSAAKSVTRLSRGVGGLRDAQAKGGRDDKSSGMWSVFAGNMLTGAVSKVAGLTSEIAHAAAGLVVFGQNTRLAFTSLAKHGAEPEKIFSHARELAKRFGLDLQDTSHQYADFLKLQFTPKAADSLIRMGADLRALGTDAEGVKGVFVALGQIKSKGRLQGDELLQLQERGVSGGLVKEEIGKAMGGKSVAEVDKLITQGKVTADIALASIEKAINRKLGQSNVGESGAKFADKTIEGMVGRFKAIGEDAGVTLVDQVTAPLTKMAGKGLDAFEKFIYSPDGVATIDKIAKGLGQAADFAMLLADSFAGAFGSTFESSVKPMFEAFGLFSDGESTAITLGKALGEVAAFAIAAGTGIVLVGGAIGKILGPVYEIGKAILTGLIDPLAKIGADMFVWFTDVFDVFDNVGLTLGEKAWEIGKAVVTGLGNGIKALAMLPVDAIMSVGSNVIDAVRGIFDSHSPSRVTMAIGADVGRGLAIGTDRSSGMVASSGMGMASAHLSGINDGFARRMGPHAPAPADDMGARMGPQMSSMNAPSFGGSGSSSGAPITLTINQNIDGAGDAEEVGRIAGREVRREIEAFFRQLSAEAG